MKQFYRALLPLLCTALLTLAMSPAWAQKVDVSEHPMIGEKAPPFELSTVAGDTVTLEGLKGKFVVLHFGASW